MNYHEALSWIHSIKKFGMKPGLERITILLERLGNPQDRLNFIHIGGTNGKGSTAAFLASILEAAGYRVGLYTSPYLEKFTNRMSINGFDIEKSRLVRLVERIKPLVEEISADSRLGQPTEFEVVTSLALTYYAQEKPDFVVFEVGLGGRLDATNIVNPLLTIITSVSLEHTQVLGDTVEKIAYEKAGIIKKNIPVVTGIQDIRVLSIIEETCRNYSAPLLRIGKEFKYTNFLGNLNGQIFQFKGIKWNANFAIPLIGEHQVKNASMAAVSAEILSSMGFNISIKDISYGLKRTQWPGRLEVIFRAPLLVIDGAHNVEAIQNLCTAVQKYFSYRHMILVLGILGDKAVRDILKEIIPIADKLIITCPDNPRAADPKIVKEIAQEFMNGPIIIKDQVPQAVISALSYARASDMILIAGSLYAISEARSAIINFSPGSNEAKTAF